MKILLAILMLAVPVFGQAPAGPVQGPPPKNLTKQPDGHVSANTDPANPEKFETHVVLAGETLSQIAGIVLKDSKLWPQLWEMNEHIVNPHWIYPNDKILVRPVTKITEATPPAPAEPTPAPAAAPAASPAPAAPAAVVAPPPAPVPPPVPSSVGIAVLSRFLANSSPSIPRAADVFQVPEPRLVPALKSSDVYCSGFIRSTPVSNLLQVSSTYQKDKSSFSTQGEYVRINHGSKGDVTAGSMYQVVRPTRKVSNPDGGIGSSLGMHYMDVGQIQIVLVQEDFSLAQVLYSCDALEPTDVLIPYVRFEIPDLPRNRSFSSAMKATGNIKGTVSFFRNSVAVAGSVYSSKTEPSAKSIVATGGVVYLNVGEAAGVKPGDLFIVYRGSAAIAEIAITKVEEKASTALVTYSTDALVLGDRVERR
jgi:hypothetical protein